MPDIEDSLCPKWENILLAHSNLKRAINKTLKYYDTSRRKNYNIEKIQSQIFLRPRSLKKNEYHVLINH